MTNYISVMLITGALTISPLITISIPASADYNEKARYKTGSSAKEKPSQGSHTDSRSKQQTDNSQLEEFSKPYQDNQRSKNQHDKSYHNNHDDHGDFWSEFWADLISDICSALIFGDFGYRYSSYPYNHIQQQLPGIYVSTDNKAMGDAMAFQFRSYYNQINHDIKSYGLYGKLLFPSSWTFDMENNRYLENTNNKTLSMNYFSFHFNTIGLTPDTNFVTEIGLGMAYLTDVTDNLHSSGSFQVRADYFPAEPWSIRTSASFSSPTNIRTTNFDATIGWHSGPLEIFGGYHSLINNKSENLNGPTFGLALWF